MNLILDLSNIERCGPETQIGEEVVYVGKAGLPSEQEEADKLFVVGQTYKVEDVEVSSWSTSLTFAQGVFNSVLFVPQKALVVVPVDSFDNWITASPDRQYDPGLWLVAADEGKTSRCSVMHVRPDGSWSTNVPFTRLKFLCEVPESMRYVS